MIWKFSQNFISLISHQIILIDYWILRELVKVLISKDTVFVTLSQGKYSGW